MMQDDLRQDDIQMGGPTPRQQSRLERQARVGILRNPNTPPRPPTRRAALTGRWPSLRSSRRPKASAVQDAAESVVEQLTSAGDGPRPAVPVRRAEDGSVQGIDIAGLMASVEEMAVAPPVRTPFAATMRADGEAATASPQPPTAVRRKADVLRAEAWLEPEEDDDALGEAFRDAAEPPEGAADTPGAERPRSPHPAIRWRWLGILLLGAVIALLSLVVFPAAATYL